MSRIEGRRPNPEDPFGAGIESMGQFGIEGTADPVQSFFFSRKMTSRAAHPSPALVPLEGVQFPLYTFCDIAFPVLRRSQGEPKYHTVLDVPVIPIPYDEFKKILEETGLVEEPNTRIKSEEFFQDEQTGKTVYRTGIGSDFSKIAERTLLRKPRRLTFPNAPWILHLMNDAVGGGEYVILCGEQVENGERVTLIGLKKGTIRLPKRATNG